MMKRLNLILLFLLSFNSHCQSWQWGKRGGASNQVSNSQRPEETYFLTTDSQKNIYGLSTVGFSSLDIDDNSKTNYDSFSAPQDIALFSFGCDGSYRWSKIIGGIGTETVTNVCIDNEDNVYIAGRVGQCNYPSYPPRIDDDFVLPQTPTMDCRRMFIAKYNTNGVLQWIRQPQPPGTQDTEASSTASRALLVDNDGNLNWIVQLPEGTFADGAFVNTQQGANFFVLKYDMNGNYISNLPLDIQLTGGYSRLNFYYNKYNGNYYFVAHKIENSATAVIGGTTINHIVSVACFNAQGVFQWVREDTFPDVGYLYLYNLEFDAQNNIYFGGRIAGLNLGSFLGFSVSETIVPGFVMKTNQDATQILWSSYNNKGTENIGGIVLNGNELGFTSYCAGTDFAWGNQTLNASNISNNEGVEVLLARFNKDTGACLGLTKIPGNIGFNDIGASITADLSGDYIVGGYIGGTLYFNNNQQITNSGSQSDFFIAKYATEPCSPLAVQEQEIKNIKLYPNPTNRIVSFDNSRVNFETISVYNYLGQEVVKPFECITQDNISIDLSTLSSGVYFIKLERKGMVDTVKVVKE